MAPTLFEEEDIYWVPASDPHELYEQLYARKFREINRQQIRYETQVNKISYECANLFFFLFFVQIYWFSRLGSVGTVNRGIWQSPTGAIDVAVKQLKPGASDEDKVKFLQEGAINGQFRHPNVVQLMGVVTVGEQVSRLGFVASYNMIEPALYRQ